jgi:hypothetical protein
LKAGTAECGSSRETGQSTANHDGARHLAP